MAIPKLRHGSFFPDWLLERLTRTERALTTVIATCYLKGVSTRRMNDLVGDLAVDNLAVRGLDEAKGVHASVGSQGAVCARLRLLRVRTLV